MIVAGLALVSALAAAAPASLAKPVIGGSYYEDNTSCSSPGSSACYAYFSAVAGGTVLVTHVTCHLEITPGLLSRARFGILDKEGNVDPSREEDLARSPVSAINTTNYYQVGGTVSFLFRPGQTPYIRINSTTSVMFVKCRLTGQRPSPM
jgi:hypothetical protein